MTETSAATREFTLTRVFKAPREEVFAAWTEPERLARWFGPRGMSTPLATISMDLRPGGAWGGTMVADAGEMKRPFAGIYREVVRPERLVSAAHRPNDPDNPQSVVSLTFAATEEGGTELTFHCTGYAAEEEKMVQGLWASSLEKLGEYVDAS